MKDKKLITFDFDDTLTHDSFFILGLFKRLAQNKNENYTIAIVTKRHDVGKVAKEIENLVRDCGVYCPIYYTCGRYKYETLKTLDVDLHIDDDVQEMLATPIGEKNRIYIFQDGIINWKKDLENIINDTIENGNN